MTNILLVYGRAKSSEDAVAYTVRMSDPVRAYLRTLSGLTRQGRLKLVAGVLGLLRDHGDDLRSDSSRRLASGSPTSGSTTSSQMQDASGGRIVSPTTRPPPTVCSLWSIWTARLVLDSPELCSKSAIQKVQPEE